MFSKALDQSLDEAFRQAREKNHEFITVEHLLLALLKDQEVCAILTACGANLDRLKVGLDIFIEETIPRVSLDMERDIQPTLSFQRVLQRAIIQVQSTGGTEVTGCNVLIAIFGEPDSQAVYFLSQENISRIDLINYNTQAPIRFERGPMQYPQDLGQHSSDAVIPQEFTQTEDELIDLYAINLNEKALAGKIDPLIGRDEELTRTIQVLSRRNKNNPLLVGEAGVGKTAIAEGLAQLIVDRKVPHTLSYATIYSLDMGMLLAGTKYRGDFEKRFKAVLKALSRQSGAIVFIDEIHNLIGAGAATGGTMDASNLIKPLLTSGDLRCMGATTYNEFRNFIAKDHALLRRFQKIDIREPSSNETLQILHGLQDRYERYHQVQYTQAALDRAVELSERYLHDRHLPDKAIDIIDEAGAYQVIQNPDKRNRLIDKEQVEEVISKIARIPLHHVSSTDKQLLKILPIRLKKVVFGQDEAIDQLTNAIKLSRAGLHDLDKPVGSFLLTGPTGVGKTEVSRQLAYQMGVELIRFDMSEYMESHAVSRLIGAPPGYVGFDQAGLLTEAIIKQPYSVLLLDEIEKAHPDIFNLLLQVMDYGHLTDNTGRRADFRHVIIIMTSNAGAVSLERQGIGFSTQNKEQDNMEAVRKIFSPEFRNRIDAVINFKSLDRDVILKIVDKELKTLREMLQTKQVRMVVSSSAKQWLMKHGYEPAMGARPMARLIRDRLKNPLADELLFGDLANGFQNVHITVEDDDLVIKIND